MMDALRFLERDRPKLKDPILIEGLPGVGNVGKLAAEHLVDQFDAVLWADIIGPDLPPQVTVQEDGTVELVRNRLWSGRRAFGGRDVVLLTGDFQPMSGQGQYELVEGVLDLVEPMGCKQIVTMGGVGLGTSVDEPGVLGAATDKEMAGRLHELDIPTPEDEPGGGIIGASGLFLGLGAMRGMQGVCIMGETSGFMVDPKGARAVLDAVGRLYDVTLDTEALEDKATEIDRVAHQLREADTKERGDLHYIG